MTHKEKLAYFAGLVDGEGYLGIKKDMIKGRGVSPVFYERMSVASIDKPTIDSFVSFFGVGKIYLHKPKKLSKRGYWSWEISNKICISVIKQLYPYLKIKKPEADIIIKFRDTFKQKYRVLPQNIIDYRDSLYKSIKSLHKFPYVYE